MKEIAPGQKIIGVVMAITPTEIQVDIGLPEAGFIPISEYSYSHTDISSELKIGDELTLVVLKVNVNEGTVMLSKKKADQLKEKERFENFKKNQKQNSQQNSNYNSYSSVNKSPEEKSKDFLDYVVKNYKIFIDTCSLLDDNAEQFWENITPFLIENNSSIIIPYRVYEEIKKHENSNHNLQQKAQVVLKRIVELYNKGLIRVLGEKTDDFADQVFQMVFMRYRMKYNLLLITQDKKLANDILNFSKSQSVRVNTKTLVRKINKYGFLSLIDNEYAESQKQYMVKTPSITQSTYQTPKENTNNTFKIAKEVTKISDDVSIVKIPEPSNTLFAVRGSNKKLIRLKSEVSSGGEGIIYTTTLPNIVAKVYKEGKAKKSTYAKIKLMVSKNIECDGVCFPTHILYNSNSEFVGYLMRQAHGTTLLKSVFMPALLKNKYFPDWKKKDTVQLCITILKKFQYLHSKNIILGDINPSNILVVSPNEVYFVDTDSYQIEGYPCPVGTRNYTAPEIQRKRYDEFLRTIENERFAVATLLFMIMLPGKSPYSMQGGEDDTIDNIINGDFAYASGERTTGKAPEGMWRYIWSHLPRYLKDDFYETFRKGGKYYNPLNRLDDSAWLSKFNHYLELLSDENGSFLLNDSMSAELFPSRLKKDQNVYYIKCRLCGNEVNSEKAEEGICYDCLKKGIKYTCAKCHKEMIYTNRQQYILKSKMHDICKECYDKLNSIGKSYPCANHVFCGNMLEFTNREVENMRRKNKPFPKYCNECKDKTYIKLKCIDCRTKFTITYGEKEYFESKNFDLPKRCESCRGGYSSGYSHKSSGCFITTAVCNYLNKPDDCYELTTLRSFRDDWLVFQPEGETLVEEYYKIAPVIVERIDCEPNKDSIYSYVWNTYIKNCLVFIENNDKIKAKSLYIEMVNELKSKYYTEEF